jgi:dCMP deaminase
MKQKFINAHMKAAEVYAELSSATRLHVGCVVVKDNTIIGIGYNGMPSGWDNVCEDIEYVLKEECQATDEWMLQNGFTETVHGWSRKKTKREVLHAETNSLAKIARSTNSSEDASLFVTHEPCLDCAKIIHQAGIKEVYYRNAYPRADGGAEFLKKCGIDVHKLDKQEGL